MQNLNLPNFYKKITLVHTFVKTMLQFIASLGLDRRKGSNSSGTTPVENGKGELPIQENGEENHREETSTNDTIAEEETAGD